MRKSLVLASILLLAAPLAGCSFKRWAYEGGNRNSWQHPERVIQAVAVRANTIITRTSSVRHRPGSGSSTSLEPCRRRVSHSPISGTIRITTGRPQPIHWLNVTLSPTVFSKTCMKIRLGGVPMGVPMPPMLAA